MQGVHYHRRWESATDGDVTALYVSPNKDLCLVGTSSGAVSIRDADGAELQHYRLSVPPTVLRYFEKSGLGVAVAGDRRMAVFDSAGSVHWERELKFHADCMDLRPGRSEILIGNRHGIYRFLDVKGKIIGSETVKHPVDFVRFAPGGEACVLAGENGLVTLMDQACKVMWTVNTHVTLIGLDVAMRARFIIAPSRTDGIVAINDDGEGVGVYELRDPIIAAKVDDGGKHIVLLDEDGNLTVLDREAKLLFREPCGAAPEARIGGRREAGKSRLTSSASWLDLAAGIGIEAPAAAEALRLAPRFTHLAVNGDGSRIVTGGAGFVSCLRRSDEKTDTTAFVEVRVRSGRTRRGGDDPVRYVEV